MAIYLFTATDPQGRAISLTEECYLFHIREGHPDMSSVDEIEQAVERPEYIARDVVDFSRLVYY